MYGLATEYLKKRTASTMSRVESILSGAEERGGRPPEKREEGDWRSAEPARGTGRREKERLPRDRQDQRSCETIHDKETESQTDRDWEVNA